MKKICEALATTSLFSGWSYDAFQEFCDKTRIRLVWKGETLVSEGDLAARSGSVGKRSK